MSNEDRPNSSQLESKRTAGNALKLTVRRTNQLSLTKTLAYGEQKIWTVTNDNGLAGTRWAGSDPAGASNLDEGSKITIKNETSNDNLDTTVASLVNNVSQLEDSFAETERSLKALEAKLTDATKTRDEMEDLEKMILPAAKFTQEILRSKLLNVKIEKANKVDAKIEILKKELERLKSSPDFMSTHDRLSARADLAHSMQVLDRQAEILGKHQALKESGNFMRPSELANLSETLVATKNRMQALQSKNVKEDSKKRAYDDLVSELECIICLAVPDEPLAFSCSNHHLMCHGCNEVVDDKCPICRQDFQKQPTTRNRLAEAMISRMNKKLKMSQP